MTIRTRITVWLGAILLVSLGLMAGVFLYELREDRRAFRNGQPLDSAWEETGEFLLYFGLPTASLLLVGGSWLLRRSLQPISRLTDAVERVHLRHLRQRLQPVGTGDELDRLTEVFNAMTARLEESFAHIREFTLHASHELKTPLTIMQGELEAALGDEHLTPAQRDLIASQLDEIQRLTKIVDSLTLLAKADAGLLPLAHEPVRLDELVLESFTDAQILARPRQVTVTLSACERVAVCGDRHRLRQLLLNLTDNALKYNQSSGLVDIALRREGAAAALTITNTGPGIAAEALPRVFDRFYRANRSHHNAIEGCGLGLSIAQWIVNAHDGAITITSEPAQRTTVTVRLPLESGTVPLEPAEEIQAPHLAFARE